jgi:hypothetical protein
VKNSVGVFPPNSLMRDWGMYAHLDSECYIGS